MLLSELRADESGMMWMREKESESCCDSRQEGGECVASVDSPEMEGGGSVVRGESGGCGGGRDAPGGCLPTDIGNG